MLRMEMDRKSSSRDSRRHNSETDKEKGKEVQWRKLWIRASLSKED